MNHLRGRQFQFTALETSVISRAKVSSSLENRNSRQQRYTRYIVCKSSMQRARHFESRSSLHAILYNNERCMHDGEDICCQVYSSMYEYINYQVVMS